MTAADLRGLADRCEAATGPDRELECTIGKAIGYLADNPPTSCPWAFSPAYTASLDAAMTLVPEGWFTFLAAEDRHSRRWSWHLRGGFGFNAKCRSETAALALTAACLRARALTQETPRG